MPRGARQRRRTVGGRERARKGTQRVLEHGKGVRKKGVRKWVLKNYANRGLEFGHSKRGTQEGVLKKRYLRRRGTQKRGYSRVFNKAEKRLRVRAAVFAGYGWAVCGISVGPTRSDGVLCGTAVCTAYSRRTHTTGALTGGSGWRLPCFTGAHARVCSDRRVLTGYFHGI